MQALDPLRLPLQGQILIEASAGTGKTYTIALLFLRLLLERKLSIDNILVVTFTKAATEELRGRIRQRIREALDALDFPAGTKQSDPLLQTVIANISNRNEARILLNDALVRMDETAISTIHGFCQRMLQDYAFESAAPFEINFIESETLLRQRIIEDFWRQNFYTESKERIARVLANWRSPYDLLNSLGGHLDESNVRCLPEINEAEYRRNINDLGRAYEALEQRWPICRELVIEQLRENKRLSRDNKKTYGDTRLSVAIQAMERLIDSACKEGHLAPEIELFARSKIESSLKRNNKSSPPNHPYFDLFERFYRLYQSVANDQKFRLLHSARHYLAEQLMVRKRALSQFYFDDLLRAMDAALKGSKGAVFAKRIGNRFPLILVDEFQDTDPLQYRIFSTIHQAAAAHTASVAGLFLIGDPKQAIYAFRGADIFTYMQARDDTPQENHFTMENNYRSTPAMVEAVNQLFDQAQSFLFENISFPRVKAAGNVQTKPLLIDKQAVAAMHCMLLPSEEKTKALDKGKARQYAAQFCASEIAQLLSSGQHGAALIGPEAISAGDIAVLVRSHAEADLARDALAQFAITSVYYSQESVFSSPEAAQLCLVLESLHDHRNEANVRSALASPIFGYTAIQLDGLLQDERQWANTLVMLAQYRKLVREKSFALLFQTLLVEHNLVKRLNGVQNGECSLTNFLHLAELIQTNAPNAGGLQGLLRWLKEQIQAPEKHAESQQLRLESDENLVKIATIHASKGLEYSVVFLPFLWSARACHRHEPLRFHAQHKPPQLTIDLGTGLPEHYMQAEQERLAEDLRLLYVAITRARHRCCFCWGNIKKMEQSALYYLLHQSSPPDQQALLSDLSRLDNEHGKIQISEFPTTFAKPIQAAFSASNSLTVMPFRGTIDKSWKITSYSGLIASHNRFIEQPDYDSVADRRPQTNAFNAFGFPRGAEAGICLHTIFESISFTNKASHKAVVAEQLARAAFAEHWLAIVLSWLTAILHTELKPGFRLAGLNATKRIDEMAFFFPLKSVRQQRLNRLLQAHGYAPLPNHQQRLNGLMSGFIDLVFEDQGQYYIADYKSNYLGDRADDYLPHKLEMAMQQHRYDLQYLIYSLALHRYLAGRMAHYRYDQHFGGVYYLFLRGMNPDYAPGNGVYFMRPGFALIDQLDKLFADSDMPDA